MNGRIERETVAGAIADLDPEFDLEFEISSLEYGMPRPVSHEEIKAIWRRARRAQQWAELWPAIVMLGVAVLASSLGGALVYWFDRN